MELTSHMVKDLPSVFVIYIASIPFTNNIRFRLCWLMRVHHFIHFEKFEFKSLFQMTFMNSNNRGRFYCDAHSEEFQFFTRIDFGIVSINTYAWCSIWRVWLGVLAEIYTIFLIVINNLFWSIIKFIPLDVWFMLQFLLGCKGVFTMKYIGTSLMWSY